MKKKDKAKREQDATLYCKRLEHELVEMKARFSNVQAAERTARDAATAAEDILNAIRDALEQTDDDDIKKSGIPLDPDALGKASKAYLKNGSIGDTIAAYFDALVESGMAWEFSGTLNKGPCLGIRLGGRE